MLSTRLTEQRMKLMKTQDDIAQLLDVHRATYGQYELGKNQPPIDKLIVLADYFNVSIDYLVGRDVENIEPIKQQLLTARQLCCSIEKILEEVTNEN